MLLTGVTLALFAGAAFASSSTWIEFPSGFVPDGIVFAQDWSAFVSSGSDGAIWRGDVMTGEGEVVVPPSGTTAFGIDYDERSGYLYVPSGLSGALRVYDSDFNLVLDLVMDPSANLTLVNTAIVAKDYVYLTDSLKSQFYVLPLDDDARPLYGANTVPQIVRIHGDDYPPDVEEFVNPEISFKASCFVLSDDEDMMLVSVVSTFELYRVDLRTGEARFIHMDEGRFPADGLVRRGNSVWMVDNGIVRGHAMIREVMLSDDWTCGRVVRIFRDDILETPTRMDFKDNVLFIVNLHDFVPMGNGAVDPYEVVRIDRDEAAVNCSEISYAHETRTRPLSAPATMVLR